MTAVWHSELAPADDLDGTLAIRTRLAAIVVGGAVVYNFILCFANTRLFTTTDSVGMTVEVALLAAALGLIWTRSLSLYALLLFTAAYFVLVMTLRGEFDPKIMRDIFIPIIFYYLGRSLGTTRTADRLVAVLLVATLVTSLAELIAPDLYLRFFDVLHYYIARGTVTDIDPDAPAGLFFNGMRYEGRSLLPFLGDERFSGLFLEPPSVGNFATIAFAWVALRDRRRPMLLLAEIAAIAVLIVLADARFGLYFCVFTLLLFAATPYIRPTLLFVLPLVIMVALAYYADAHWRETWDNTMSGRFLLSGSILSSLTPLQILGLQGGDMKSGAAFATNGFGDSGYSYMLVTVGLGGMAALWGLFVYARPRDPDAARYKSFLAFYYILLLAISSAVFTIKTAALLWYLYGTLNNPNNASEDREAEDAEAEDVEAGSVFATD
jgi:putative polymerase